MTRTELVPYLVALAAALLIYGLVRLIPRRSASKALSGYYDIPTRRQDAPPAPVGSNAYKIRLACTGFGLDVAGREELARWAAYILVSLAAAVPIAISSLPPMVYLVAPAVAFVAVNGVINSRWNNIRLGIEKEIPTLLLRVSAVVQASPNVLDALTEVTASLNPDGPLKAWMERFTQRLQSSGQKGLEDALTEATAISPSLALVVIEIGRLWETGGIGYIEAFRLVSDNLAGILEARAQAAAKSAGAWGTVRIILLALGFAIYMVMGNPGTAHMFHAWYAQLGLLAVLIWAAVGWNIIGDTIQEATR